ncbi:MAG TPA: tRNA (adenosine(37)-N6)-dimethylallyltransferase MiaA [Actinomycetota bacterium]|jgi:tRNA dimethylallyltransferase|nr:tRNA (adenosine(37)-N6)-dimethylallyltransferase MiaA [Actinomycetota bacterium]
MPAVEQAPPLALVGPTAAGKTEASLELARRLDGEVVTVDSMVVYRGMDVGTAKPTAEQRAAVPHHLVDVTDPVEPFSVARFQALAREAMAAIGRRGHHTLLVGGSGLYFRAVVDGLVFPGTDPVTRGMLESEAAALGPARMHARLADADAPAAAKIEPGNVRRTVRALEVAALTGRPFSQFAEGWERYPGGRVRVAGVRIPPAVLALRIESRVHRMVEGGLVEEVRALLDRGFDRFLTSVQAIGYLEMAEHLGGRISLEEAARRTIRRTSALARRQMAWFRRDPRIEWFDAGAEGAVGRVDDIERFLREPALMWTVESAEMSRTVERKRG